MIAGEIESRSWSHRRWVAVIALVLILHVGLLFWLGDRKASRALPMVKGPAMYLPADQTAAWPGLSDPTLFVLPNSHGFSGPAWLKLPTREHHLKEWTEPEPAPVLLPEPGRTLNEFVRDSLSKPFEVARKPEPQLDTMNYPPSANLAAAHSTFTIEGELAGRRLLSTLELASWPAVEILTNSEVLVAVNPEGSVFSAVLLAKCGAKDDAGAKAADASAMELARSAHFQPLRWKGPGQPAVPSTRLTWGRLVFHWRTSALPDTNAPPKNP